MTRDDYDNTDGFDSGVENIGIMKRICWREIIVILIVLGVLSLLVWVAQ